MRSLRKLTGRARSTAKKNSHKERKDRKAESWESKLTRALDKPTAMTIPSWVGGRNLTPPSLRRGQLYGFSSTAQPGRAKAQRRRQATERQRG